MSDAGDYSDDDYGDQDGNSQGDDKLSLVESDPASDEDSEQIDLMNQEDNEDQAQESDPQYPMSSIIDDPIFTVSNVQRITPPFLTKYQKARVIGVRAMQISKNSPLYLNADDKDLSHWDPLFIAQKQLAEEKIPFIIRRHLPDSSFQDWKLCDLKSLD